MENRSIVPPAIVGCLGVLFTFIGLAALGMYAISSGGSAAIPGLSGSDAPAEAGFDDGRPVGLYFMTRYWIATGSLEKAVWYFAPDGTVYEKLSTGFSEDDLAAHEGRKGKAGVEGDQLTVTWSDGKSVTSKIEPDGDGEGFAWDMGLFAPVTPFEDEDTVLGSWEGGESLSFSGNSAAVSKTLQLRENGTYEWSGVSSFTNRTEESEVTAGGESSASGTWKLSGYSMILTGTDGRTTRGIAFPFDDEETAVKPDRFFFAGTMYKKQG